MTSYLDGAWVDQQEARISIDDAGLLHGDGVFETALLRHGRYFRLSQHLARFARSASTLGLQPPPGAVLHEIASELAARNELRDGSFRVTLTRGSGAGPTLFATLKPIDAAWRTRAAAGWRLITARTCRPSVASIPAQLKSLGRPYALLARAEARAAGVDDALLLTDEGLVCEGPAWTLFWVRDRVLYTPTLGLGVLAGVTRSVLMELAPELGFDVREVSAPRSELDGAQELFATMTSVGIVSIRELDGRTLPERGAAELLREAYWNVVDREGAQRE